MHRIIWAGNVSKKSTARTETGNKAQGSEHEPLGRNPGLPMKETVCSEAIDMNSNARVESRPRVVGSENGSRRPVGLPHRHRARNDQRESQPLHCYYANCFQFYLNLSVQLAAAISHTLIFTRTTQMHNTLILSMFETNKSNQ